MQVAAKVVFGVGRDTESVDYQQSDLVARRKLLPRFPYARVNIELVCNGGRCATGADNQGAAILQPCNGVVSWDDAGQRPGLVFAENKKD